MAKTIIEKEIERRETLIAEKADKEALVLEMQAEIEKTKAEIAGIDEVALKAEIEELKDYLPKPEPAPANEEVAEAEEVAATTPYFTV